MKKYFSHVRCLGNERSLEDCTWEDHAGSIQCKRPESVAGIICTSGSFIMIMIYCPLR